MNAVIEKVLTSGFTKMSYAYLMDQKSKLGEGAFGEVYKGINCNTNEVVAIKAMYYDQIERYGPELINAVGSEVNILQNFMLNPCPYIIKIFDCFKSDKYIYVILEYCDEGTLTDEIKKNATIVEDRVKIILGQVMEALQVLHSSGISHRDLKPDNIFKKQGTYKLGDFGFATTKKVLNNYVGTPLYMAPELWAEELNYDCKVDIWAIGVVFYEMLFGTVPFKKDRDIVNLELSIPSKPVISQECKDLLKRMLSKDPKTRASTYECLKHPFLDSGSQNKAGNSFFDSKNLKELVDQSILKEKLRYIQIKLENFLNTIKSVGINTMKNVRVVLKNDQLILQYILIKRVFYHSSSLYEHLVVNSFPQDILNMFVEDIWKIFINTPEYLQIKENFRKFQGAYAQIFEKSYENVKDLPIDMSNSFLLKAINKDIAKDFTGSFTLILNQESNNIKQKINSPSCPNKEDYERILFDLRYFKFIDENLKVKKNEILFEKVILDRNNLLISEIEAAIKSEVYFNRYSVPIKLGI